MWTWAGPKDDSRLSESAKATYYKEWGEIIDQQQVFPSVVVWVPFNEGWSQFDTYEVVAFTKKKDPSRLVNSASGGNSYRECGDIFDSHNYPDPHIKFTSEGRQMHSVVRNMPATEAAFSRATRATLVGSMTPASYMFTYSSVRAL